ncbi:hypothetical protein D3C81_1604790 [compost metagenome]
MNELARRKITDIPKIFLRINDGIEISTIGNVGYNLPQIRALYRQCFFIEERLHIRQLNRFDFWTFLYIINKD